MSIIYGVYLMQMEAMSRGTLLSKVVEAYSRPTRIVRGKDVDADVEVYNV